MPIVIILFFFWSIGRYVDLSPLYVSCDSAWYTYLTFSFAHVNFLHLLLNCIVFMLYWRQAAYLSKREKWELAAMCLAVPPMAALLSVQYIPTCGFSSVVFVMLGYLLSKTDKKSFARAAWVIVISMTISLMFARGINNAIHIYSLIIPLACCAAKKEVR